MAVCGNNCSTEQIFRDFKELLERRKEDFHSCQALDEPLDCRLTERIDKLLCNVDQEVAVELLSEMLLCDSSFTYVLALEFVPVVVNDDEPEPANLGQLLYTMLLFIEDAQDSTTDLAVLINAYLSNRYEWEKWDWKTLELSIELGLNWLTYDEVRTRIADNFLERADEEYDIVRVVDRFDHISDLPCHLDDLSFRSKWFLEMTEETEPAFPDEKMSEGAVE